MTQYLSGELGNYTVIRGEGIPQSALPFLQKRVLSAQRAHRVQKSTGGGSAAQNSFPQQ